MIEILVRKKKFLTKKKFLVKISQICAAKVRGTSSWHESMVIDHELLPWKITMENDHENIPWKMTMENYHGK